MAGSDWDLARANLENEPSRWGSLSWISAKALIDSVNHALDRFSDGLVPQLRSHWVATTTAPELRVIERPDITSFVIIGDTGEKDASQYVVCPSLSAAVRDHRPGFVMIASDVIYPAGDVDDYLDGVYRPYRSADPNFSVNAPLLGLPGNHDWYDGLAGFMYHFTGQDRLPAAAYAPQGWRPRALLGGLSRILWRRAPRPRPATTARRDDVAVPGTNALTRDLVQPGPYYAIRTRHLLVVAIDTGINGLLDQEQWAWLKQISAEPGPKILVTGKPLLVNGRLDPCWVGAKPEDGVGDSVWDLVNEPAYGYLATVGGDVHNFQQYRPLPKDASGPALHLVSGGGGALLHATHTYANADYDSRVRNNPNSRFYALPERSFPSRDESFSHFAQLLVPSVVRIMGHLLLFLAGVLTGSIGSWLDPLPGVVYTLVVAGLAAVALLLLVLVRTARRQETRTSTLARRVVSAGSFATGMLAAAAAYQLDPDHFQIYLTAWLGFTGFHCVVGALVRRSGWWRPADEYSRNPRWPTFAVGVVVLCGLAYGLLHGLDPMADRVEAVAGAVLIFVVAWIGFWARRPRFTAPGVGGLSDAEKTVLGRRNRRWHQAGTVLVPAVQAVVIALGLHQLAESVGRLWLFWGALTGLGLVVVVAIAVSAALVVLTELGTLPARLGEGSRSGGYARAWGVASGVVHYLSIPLLLGALALLIGWADGPTARATVGLPLVVYTVGSYLVWVVWLRPRIGRAYVVFAIGVPVGLLVVGYLTNPWWARVALATAIVLLALGVSLTMGHLAFLGAQLLVVTPGGLKRPTFTPDQIEAIFAARRQRPVQVPTGVPANVLLWARLTSPGLGEPGGLLQQKVAEIFSSDLPPFHKSFLRLDTTEHEMQITLHQVFGELPATT
ncbi:MAG TPA: hypothetical protein VNT24_07525, partial [Propionibacteriaceae bacterium]|nr:hypothetical protein [Propionibacteriaceae bacterium]